jgi:hypothetical protein
MPEREDGFYWVILLEARLIPRWTPAEFFNGEWFFPGIRQAIPERELQIGARIEHLPLPDPSEVKRRPPPLCRLRSHPKRLGVTTRK